MRSAFHRLWRFPSLPKFGNDFGPTAFRPFLLWNSIVGALKRGLATIPTLLEAVTANL